MIDYYGDRFLDLEKFLDFCKNTEITFLSKESLSKWLEYLEKEKIIFPVIRTIFPKSLIEILFRRDSDPTYPYYRKDYIPLPKKLIKYNEIIYHIDKFHYNRKCFFHYFDKKYCDRIIVHTPREVKYCKWNSYQFYKNVNGFQEKLLRAQTYYSYYQVYYIFEYTLYCQLILTIKKKFTDNDINLIIKNNISPKLIFSRHCPGGRGIKNDKFWKSLNDFEALSFYIQSYNKINDYCHFYLSKDFVNIKRIEGKNFDIYESYIKRLTKITIIKYSLTEKRIIDFIKFLCEKYFYYQEFKKDVLCNYIKKDIGYCILLLENGFNLHRSKIFSIIGKITMHPQNTLNVIFPDKFSDAKKNVLNILDNFILIPDLKPNRQRVEKFIEFIDSTGLDLFYIIVQEINKNFWATTIYDDRVFQSNLITLAIYFEEIMRRINISLRKNENDSKLKHYVSSILGEELFIKSIDKDWYKLTSIGTSNFYEKYLSIQNYKINLDEKSTNIIKVFLQSALIRNASVHVSLKILTLEKDLIFEIIKNLITAIWYAWQKNSEKLINN